MSNPSVELYDTFVPVLFRIVDQISRGKGSLEVLPNTDGLILMVDIYSILLLLAVPGDTLAGDRGVDPDVLNVLDEKRMRQSRH